MMTRARVMIVEDDRIVARDIGEQLGRIGHTVIGVTARGETAVALAVAHRPDLILMDIRLQGDMDGIDAAQQIRAQCRIPVVFLTAYADDETVRRASHAEPFGYLLKPFEDLQLRTAIEMALYKHAADRKLRDSERRYEATLFGIADGVIATDERGRIAFINPVAEALTGWARHDAIGRPLASVYCVDDGDSQPLHDGTVAGILASGTVRRSSNTATLISSDGTRRPVDETVSPIVDDAGAITGAVLVFSDTSERRRAAAALQKAQTDLARMARVTTMGQLTASIAHEVNQPLMAAVLNADACVKWLDDGRVDLAEARAAAGRAAREGHRAGEIVSRIRALARNAPVTFDTLDINDMVADMLAFVRTDSVYQTMAIRADLPPGRLPVVGDRVQLQQVMLNLLANAADAIAAGGGERQLTVGTRLDESGAVCVTIDDSGAGIDAAVAEQIFEAFFTTKSEGIGMGLSICRSIIDAHGGRLWTEPLAHGTRFGFALPQCQI